MAIRPIFSSLLRNKTGALLIVAQVAISLAILSNALFVVSERLTTAARASGVADEQAVFHINVTTLQSRHHMETMAAQHRDEAILRAIPGVRSVTSINQMPLSQNGQITGLFLSREQKQASASVGFYYASGPAVKTLGLNIVEGRDLTEADVVEVNPEVDMKLHTVLPVLISQALANRLYPSSPSAVGMTVFDGSGADAQEFRVAGVVEHLQTPHAQTRAEGDYSILLPARVSDGGAHYAIRTEPGQTQRVMRDVASALQKADHAYLIRSTATVADDRAERYQNDHALSWMLVVVCVLLLLVTASGIVGMASFWINQRRKHIGVRRALGARKRDILIMFLTENMLITSTGAIAGLLLTAALNQLLISQLEMSKLPLQYPAAGVAVLWLLGLLSVYAPAWRAASISPAIATRSA